MFSFYRIRNFPKQFRSVEMDPIMVRAFASDGISRQTDVECILWGCPASHFTNSFALSHWQLGKMPCTNFFMSGSHLFKNEKEVSICDLYLLLQIEATGLLSGTFNIAGQVGAKNDFDLSEIYSFHMQ